VHTKNQKVTEEAPEDSEQLKVKAREEILETAKKRFELAVEAEASIRKDALDDLKFSAGDQWPSDIKSARDSDRRPSLTINRLPQSIHQLTNDQRQNRPAIKVSPVDDRADIETAKIFQGIIRHIEYSSNADTAYDTAFDSAVRAGFGYFRVITEYCDPKSFEQEIRIKRIRNRFSVYLDPSYQEPDGSDANWGFIVEDISKEDYKAQYPESELASMDDWSTTGDTKPGWSTTESARVAEYFHKELKETKLLLLNDKSVVTKDEFDESVASGIIPEGIAVVSERVSHIPVIKWCKINGVEILEETEWPSKWIPIIPVLGEELDIDGVRTLTGIVRHAKDPQRMYNYWASAETETIALAPRAPFIGVEGQFEGHENQWKTANTKNHAFLEYKPKSIGGQPVGPPQRNVYEPPVQAITQARMMASDDLKATTGIYDAALGNRSNENSGIAIQRRSLQAQTSNFHFIDNLSKSIRHLGRILVDLIPHIYDTDRAVRILGEDGSEEIVRINELFERKGKPVKYDLSTGKYDVTINTGRSFETKRQEAVQSMLDLTKAYPQVAQVAGDLMVRNMDWPGAQDIADRLKKSLPPGLADDKDKKQPIPPEVQAQMGQMNQLIEQLTGKLNEAQDKLDTKSVELESRERIEMAKIQANIEIELAKMGSQEAQILLKQEVAEIQSRLSQLNYDQPFEHESNLEPEMSGAGPAMGQMPPDNQQPTGGSSPGELIGE